MCAVPETAKPPVRNLPPSTNPPSEATLLKEWEVRHNAAVQFHGQFLAFETIAATAMTAGLGYTVNITDKAMRFYPLCGLLVIAVGFTVGSLLGQFVVGHYRRRLNALAQLLGFPAQNELLPLQIALWLSVAFGITFASVALYSLQNLT